MGAHSAVYIKTPARAKEWKEYTTKALDNFLHLIKDNNTRWFSIYLMLVRAVLLKNTIIVFTAQNLVSDKDENNLSKCIISWED
jgi:hypothetical protein